MGKPTLNNEILQALSARGALNRHDLAKHVSGERSPDALSVALNVLKHAGLVEPANNKCWRVTDAGRHEARTAVKDGAQMPAPATVKESLTVDTPPTARITRPRPQDDVEPTRRSRSLAQVIENASQVSVAMTALRKSAQHAQDAIDAYVWEVGDPAVLEPLMTSRDAAREALTAYEAQS